MFRAASARHAAIAGAAALSLISQSSFDASPSPYSRSSLCAAPPVTPSSPFGDRRGIEGAVGNTPLVYLKSLSAETKCHIYGKAEYLNPSGSVKDRTALGIIQEAERSKKLQKGGTIVEATGGNTGIALAQLGAAKGYNVILCAPNNIASEKVVMARRFGATVNLCPVVPFSHRDHYVHAAERAVAETPGALYCDQFENLANFRAHYATTGPEIFKQTEGEVDAFVVSCGTGGTLAGVSSYLGVAKPACKCYVIDPSGSVLFEYVSSGVVAMTGASEIEGIGINRITDNFRHAKVEGALRGTDQEAVNMAYYVMEKEGLFIGPSAALNLVGAVKVARKLGPGHTVVTVLCDGGERYMSKLYNEEWLKVKNLTPNHMGTLSFVQYTPILTAERLHK